jgi:hypothetical protein
MLRSKALACELGTYTPHTMAWSMAKSREIQCSLELRFYVSTLFDWKIRLERVAVTRSSTLLSEEVKVSLWQCILLQVFKLHSSFSGTLRLMQLTNFHTWARALVLHTVRRLNGLLRCAL